MAMRVRDGAFVVVVVVVVALLMTLLQPWCGRDRLGPTEVVGRRSRRIGSVFDRIEGRIDRMEKHLHPLPA